MITFLTVCTIRQLPQALALGESLQRHHPSDSFVLGLCDDPSHLPTGFTIPYPVILLSALLLPDQDQLSQQYTPAEFVAACKPLFIKYLYSNQAEDTWLVYLDPSVYLYQPLTDLQSRYADATLLLTPHLLKPLTDNAFPDEKHVQNIGLYSSGCIGLRHTAETTRFLNWWSSRVPERAFARPCEGMYTDQIWLVLTPGLFESVTIAKNPGWHVGLWNLHERPTDENSLVFLNYKGIVDQEGYFQAQTRVKISAYPAIQKLRNAYQSRLRQFDPGANLGSTTPAYGLQPFKPPLKGWRKKTVETLRETVQFIENVDIPRNMK
ncbi:hypothetical protein LX87_05097 [Larkinella arboricola]|uniref:Uncharacterized protein n=1 Tax=Larkinella arboricola TaxID=643671 RepID=A0A327WK20_LARAB|nr:hypothetical protein [Larkinella arboricola]RAJ92133.1 hypothetical protein LX87_05097 [Larkinella arboricola]